ncbi:ANTAR domain-containing protein [Angustibacter aerolatus]
MLDQPEEAADAARFATTAEALAQCVLGADLSEASTGREVHEAVVHAACRSVPGVEHASLVLARGPGRPRVVAGTDELAVTFDRLQLRLGRGPVLDVLGGAPVSRWRADEAALPGSRLREDSPVTAALTLRLEPPGHVGALTLSGSRELPPEAVGRARTAAALAVLALTADLAGRRSAHLDRALDSNRRIGVAVGVLTARRQLTPELAFDELRRASQRLNRKLASVADEVAATGALPTGPADDQPDEADG